MPTDTRHPTPDLAPLRADFDAWIEALVESDQRIPGEVDAYVDALERALDNATEDPRMLITASHLNSLLSTFRLAAANLGGLTDEGADLHRDMYAVMAALQLNEALAAKAAAKATPVDA